MSRLDRLVRNVGPYMDDAEALLASVVGRRADGRGHVALVATDRRLLLVTEGFTRVMVDELPYGELTSFDRVDEHGTATVEVVATEARWRLERIELDAEAGVALELIERRCRAARTAPAGATAAAPAIVPPRVRILPSSVG